MVWFNWLAGGMLLVWSMWDYIEGKKWKLTLVVALFNIAVGVWGEWF